MKWEIEITNIYIWYRNSTKEWVISVAAKTNYSCSISINYSSKKLNKAKKMMFKNLAKDLMQAEIEYSFNDILTKIEDVGEA